MMYFLSSVVDSSTVQGNIEKHDELKMYLFRLHYDLNWNLMSNLYKWEVRDYNLIIDTVMAQLELFISRTVGNKEREALIPTLRTHEISRVENAEKSGSWNIPLFGKKGK